MRTKLTVKPNVIVGRLEDEQQQGYGANDDEVVSSERPLGAGTSEEMGSVLIQRQWFRRSITVSLEQDPACPPEILIICSQSIKHQTLALPRLAPSYCPARLFPLTQYA